MKIFAVFTIVLTGVGAGWAQAPGFAVASVKPSGAAGLGEKGEARMSIAHGPDSLTMRNVSLKSSIQWAWGVADYQVLGPGWIASESFDITAKAEMPVSEADLRLMLRSLLAARLHLALHRETRELPVYELGIGKNGPKLRKAEESEERSARPEGGDFVFRNVPMDDLAVRLAGFPFRVQRPVLDRTGLTGGYDFRLRVADSVNEMKKNMEHADEGFVFELVQSQLGLKLTPKKDPLEVLVVDEALRVPVEN